MQTVLSFTVRCYSSRYFPTAANEPEVSQKTLKNKVDILIRITLIMGSVILDTSKTVATEMKYNF